MRRNVLDRVGLWYYWPCLFFPHCNSPFSVLYNALRRFLNSCFLFFDICHLMCMFLIGWFRACSQVPSPLYGKWGWWRWVKWVTNVPTPALRQHFISFVWFHPIFICYYFRLHFFSFSCSHNAIWNYFGSWQKVRWKETLKVSVFFNFEHSRINWWCRPPKPCRSWGSLVIREGKGLYNEVFLFLFSPFPFPFFSLFPAYSIPSPRTVLGGGGSLKTGKLSLLIPYNSL